MSKKIIASRYAVAFFDSVPEDRLEPIKGALKMVTELFQSEHDLWTCLVSPVVSHEKKAVFLQKIIDKIMPPEEIGMILQLLLKKGRFMLLPEVCQKFSDLVQEHYNVAVAYVRSAYPIDDTVAGSLKKKLEGMSGKILDVQITEDKSLIAGLVVKIKDVVYDYSISNKLKMLRSRLLADA